MKKGKKQKYSRILSLLLAVCMVFTMMPGMAWASETNLTFSENKIDITDAAVGSYTLTHLEVYEQGTNRPVSIVSASQDGTTINVVLAADMNPSAALQAGLSGSGQGELQHSGNTCTLSGGIGTMQYAVTVIMGPQLTGSTKYTINFTMPMGEACSVSLPEETVGFTISGKDSAYIGGSYSFSVDIAEGYTGANMVVKANNDVLAGINGNYTVDNVTGDLTITVEGVEPRKRYNVTLLSGDGYTVNGKATVYEGDDYTFTVSVDPAYKSDAMTVKANGNEVIGTNGSYTVESVKDNLNITVEGVEPKTVYTVTLPTSDGYTASGPESVYEGDEYIFTVTIHEGYNGAALTVKANDEVLTGSNGNYTVEGVTEDLTITVGGVAEKEKCTVTLPTGEGYTVTGKDFAYKNEAYTFTVTINKGYIGTNMKVYADGTEITGSNGSYTISSVEKDIKITVEGVEATGVTPTTIYTGNTKPNNTWGYVSSIVVDAVQVEESIWVGDHAYVTLIPRTKNDAAAQISFTTGGLGRGVSITGENAFTLVNGKADKAFTAMTDSFNYTWNFTIHLSNKGFAPTLADGINGTAEVSSYVNEVYALDLAPLFSDIFGKELTYYVKVDSGEFTAVDGTSYEITPTETGTKTLTFKANNGKLDSEETYTVTLKVQDLSFKTITVKVPETITPEFYATESFDANGTDVPGAQLNAGKGAAADGMVPYTMQIDSLAETISVRAGGWGGMAVPAKEDSIITMRPVQTGLVDLSGKELEGTVTVAYGERKAAAGEGGKYLLETGREHSYTSAPADTAYQTITENKVLEEGTEPCDVILKLGINNAITITTTTGAVARLYNYDINKYYYATEFEPKIIKDNGDGTTTYYFSANGNCLIYHVSMEGKITKAGYFDWNQKNVNAVYAENDKADTYRLDDYSGTGEDNSSMTEDSVLLNINGQNNLSMSVDDTKTLKAYRAWEIIKISYQNYIITPNFHFNILQGEDVVSLTDKDSPSVGDGDWKTLTALKEGTAIIEVTYDALELAKGTGNDATQYSGTYGASDPARTGLAVIQVGGHDDSVNFGIESKASMGSTTYSSSNAKDWDAEFDTLYFTGDSGKLHFAPTADGTINKVEVSGDKGSTWTELNAEEGKYTADIVSGNNIIKVTTDAGTAYQVVRGDKIKVRYVEVDEKSDKDGNIEAGETIRIYFDGLHTPIPKMAGNYNPSFTGNTDGDSIARIKYTFDGKTIRTEGPGWQYSFITDGNYIDVTIPAETTETSFTLSDGYIGVGVIGLTKFADGGDSHRNITDVGCGTRGSDTTFNTRSIMPDITLTVGQSADPNTAPIVNGSAQKTASVELGKNYAINPETLFTDADGDSLTFTVSVNNGEAESADAAYKFTPSAAGTYTIKFTANDGKATAEHTITLTVTEAAPKPEEPTGPVFNVPGSIGEVTVSFVDFATRKEGETGLKYPVALGTIVPATKVPFRAGETIEDVTLRLLDAYEIGYGASYGPLGFYLASINNFEVDNTLYDSMGEFDAGNGSGWMITHNNVFIGQSAGNTPIKAGDVIEWKFTCQLGADIGDPYWDDKKDEEEVKDVITNTGTAGGAGAPGEPVTTTTPTEVTVSGTTATATITKENVAETIKQATENKASEIVVQVSASDSKGAANVKVQLDTTTVKDVVGKTEAALTVKTENATVTLDRETLKTVVAEAAGSTVTLEVIEVAKPTEAIKEAAGENGHVIQLVIKSGNKIISLFNEGKATVTVEIPTKLDGKKVAAIHIADDGTIEHLEGQEVTVGGKKHYRFDTPHFSTFALVDADEIGLEVEDETVLTEDEVKALIADLTPVARSSKTAKKNIKVTLKLDTADKAIIEQLEDAGYTVKYNFYRSTRKASKYSSRLIKDEAVYTQTGGTKGKMYYYKARVQVYDADGKLVARTDLKQCKYAKRKWAK